jgi:putative serine protease PepD
MTTGPTNAGPTPDAGRASRRGYLRAPMAVAAAVLALLVGVVIGVVVGKAVAGPAGPVAAGTAGDASPSVCPATTVATTGLPSVVTIAAQPGGGGPGGTGSGEIIRAGGYILTNDHVISVAANGGAVSVRYSDGRTSSATIVGRDVLTDLAVLKASDGASGLPVIASGSSQGLAVGQPVVALGAPLGLVDTVTSGIISAMDREVALPADQGQTAHLVGAIQTDAAINPGNSGGALVNCQTQLVGVNTAIATVPNSAGQAGGGSVGLGFAIPVDLANPIADELIATGAVAHFSAGLEVRAVPGAIADRVGLPRGLVVESVVAGGPADAAGIRARDVLTLINGQPAVSAEQVTVAELAARSGHGIEVAYLRGGTTTTVTVTPAPLKQ